MVANMDIMKLYASTVFKVEATFEQPKTFAIITAHNPLGVVCSNQNNNTYHQQFSQQLKSAGYHQYAQTIWGCSPDLTHQEISYALVITKQQALLLASHLNQNAIFWVDHDQLTIIPVKLVGVTELAVGSFKQLIVSG